MVCCFLIEILVVYVYELVEWVLGQESVFVLLVFVIVSIDVLVVI